MILQTSPSTLLTVIIPAVATVVVCFITIYGAFWLKKKFYDQEVKGKTLDNEGAEWKNTHFKNQVADEIYEDAREARELVRKLSKDNHSLKITVDLKDLEIARAQGATELALKQKENVADEIQKLRDAIVYEHNQCQQQILEITTKYESRIQYLEFSVDTFKTFLMANNLEVPEIPATAVIAQNSEEVKNGNQ